MSDERVCQYVRNMPANDRVDKFLKALGKQRMREMGFKKLFEESANAKKKKTQERTNFQR